MTTVANSETSTQSKRPRRWRRRALWLLLLVVAAVGARVLYVRLTDPQRVGAMAARELSRLTGTEVHVREAHIKLRRPLELYDLEMRVPGLAGEHGRLFTAQRVTVEYDGWKMLIGSFRARRVDIDHPTLWLSEDGDSGKFNVQTLYELNHARPGPTGPPPPLPQINPIDLTLCVGQTSADGHFSARGSVAVHLEVKDIPDRRDEHEFVVTQNIPGAAPQPIWGKFNSSTGEFTAHIDRFQFDPAQKALLPRAVAKLWDEFQPAGQWKDLSVWMNPGAKSNPEGLSTGRQAASGTEANPGAGGVRPQFSIHAQPDHFSVRLVDRNPVPGTQPATGPSTLPPIEYRPELVSGTIEVNSDGLMVKDLRGQLEGFECLATGHWRGFDEEAPFEVTATMAGTTKAEARYWASLPVGVRNYFNRFQPLGRLEASAHFWRGTPGGPVGYAGKVRFNDVQARYHKFPYPLQHLFGDLDFSEERITIHDMHGKLPSGGAVTINVLVEPPSDDARMHIVVTAKEMPIDSRLYAAIIDLKDLAVVHSFFNETAKQKLVDAGLIAGTPTTQPAADAEAATRSAVEAGATTQPAGEARPLPDFVLGGQTDVNVQVDRAAGFKQPYDTQITLLPAGVGVNMLNDGCLYPFHIEGGALTIKPNKGIVIAKDMVLRGLSGATAVVNGTFAAPDNKPLVPDIQIEAAHVPLDGLLKFALGHDAAILDDLRLTGEFAATGRLGPNAQGKVSPDLQIDFRGGMKPFAGTFELSAVTAAGKLEGQKLTITSAQGRRGQSQLSLTGNVQFATTRPALELSASASRLHFDDPLADLLPPEEEGGKEIRDLQSQYHPRGQFDATVHYQRPAGGPATFNVVLKPQALGFDYQGARVELAGMKGAMAISPQQIELQTLTGNLGPMQLSGNGTIDRAAGRATEMDLQLKGGKWDVALQQIMPPELTEAFDAISLGGGLDFTGHLARRETDPNGAPANLRLQGQLDLHDVKAEVGLPLTHAEGSVDVLVTRTPADKRARLDLKFALRSVRAQERLVNGLTLRVRTSNVNDVDALVFEDLKGGLYGGTITGKGQVMLGAGGQYGAEMAVHDAALDPFVHPEADQHWQATTQAASRPTGNNESAPVGTIVAYLAIGGKVGKPETKSGGGDLEVQGARLFELPLFLSLLDLPKLGWPTSHVINRASAQFMIEGDLVHLDKVHLGSEKVDIDGSGTMVYSTEALDLALTIQSRTGLPIFSELVGWIENKIVGIHVGGTLSNPQPGPRMLPGMRSVGRDVVGGLKQPPGTLPPVNPKPGK